MVQFSVPEQRFYTGSWWPLKFPVDTLTGPDKHWRRELTPSLLWALSSKPSPLRCGLPPLTLQSQQLHVFLIESLNLGWSRMSWPPPGPPTPSLSSALSAEAGIQGMCCDCADLENTDVAIVVAPEVNQRKMRCSVVTVSICMWDNSYGPDLMLAISWH